MRKGLKFTLSFLFVSILTLNSCLNIKENIVVFGKLENGEQVYKYLLKNNDCEVEVITYGGIITSIKVPDKNNNLIDVALGFDNLEPYLNKHTYFGAIVGRYANRIDNGKFILNNVEYNLAVNNNGASLHGGIKGFDKVNWEVVSYDSENKRSIRLNYLSKDMEEGYPGNLETKVIYTLNNMDELTVNYEAKTDKTTIVNLTQHSYFNLSGNFNNDILSHELVINADSFIPVDTSLIPIGEIRKVQGTPFDFKKRKKIGKEINYENQQIKNGKGYDHCWVLNDQENDLRFVGSVYEEKSGRFLKFFRLNLVFNFTLETF